MPAAIPIVAAVAGGYIASRGAKSAADTQAASADRAAAMQNEQYQQTRADQAPYRQAGYTALSQLSGGTAAGGEFNKNFSMADYQADPGYQFRIDQGEQGINRAATASGSRYSGATLKALARFNSGLASQEYGAAYNRYNTDQGTRFNRLASLAGIGQTATQQTDSAGSTAATVGGQAVQNAGESRASGYVGSANAINGTLGSLANNYQQYRSLSSMAPNGTNDYNGTSPGYGVARDLRGYDAQENGGWGIE